jgi:hypothetical protein
MGYSLKLGTIVWVEWHGKLVRGTITGLGEDTIHWR